jgi:RNA polymerase sigma factor (TIGR02999 family)
MHAPDGGRSAGEVTRLLREARDGDSEAFDRLFPLVYDELHGAAQRALRAERPGHTLQPTELVHEAVLKLLGGETPAWQSRGHFVGIVARAMRQVLVDHARRRNAAKRGGGQALVTLEEQVAAAGGRGALDPGELLALDEALDRLDAFAPRLRQVVELRWFAGLEEREIAQALGVTERTVQRDWAKARAWLHSELAPSSGEGAQEG